MHPQPQLKIRFNSSEIDCEILKNWNHHPEWSSFFTHTVRKLRPNYKVRSSKQIILLIPLHIFYSDSKYDTGQTKFFLHSISTSRLDTYAFSNPKEECTFRAVMWKSPPNYKLKKIGGRFYEKCHHLWFLSPYGFVAHQNLKNFCSTVYLTKFFFLSLVEFCRLTTYERKLRS